MRTLIEVDAFSADVDVPEDGDARDSASVDNAFQALANRGKYLKARHEELGDRVSALEDVSQIGALYRVRGTALADEDLLTYATSTLITDGFSLADSDQHIQVPSAGVYRLSMNAYGTLNTSIDDDADTIHLQSSLGAPSTDGDFRVRGVKTLLTTAFSFVGEMWVTVRDPGADLIFFELIFAAHSVRTMTFTGLLSVQKTNLPLPPP